MGVGVDRLAANVHFAVIGVQQCGDHPHRRGFARTVRTDEAEHVPFAELQVELVDGDEIAEAFCQFPSFNHGRVRYVIDIDPTIAQPVGFDLSFSIFVTVPPSETMRIQTRRNGNKSRFLQEQAEGTLLPLLAPVQYSSSVSFG